MNDDLADALVRRIRDAAAQSDARIVRRAIESYRPSNLSELYMAVRAVSDGAATGLVEDLRRRADDAPELGIAEFLRRPPGPLVP